MVINKNNEGEKGKVKFSAKEKILKHLIENKEPQSIRSISGSALIDYKNTYQIIESLQPNIVFVEKLGNTNLVRIKSQSGSEVFSVEDKRTNDFLDKNRKLELVKKDIDSVNYPFFIVLVFGSYIKGTHNEKSDIDLCIICDNSEKLKKLTSKLGLLPIKLELHTFTIEEFESMLKTKEENVGKEVVKKNIILYGIDNYYNLISKWT